MSNKDFFKTTVNGKEIKIPLPELSLKENPLIKRAHPDLTSEDYLQNPMARVVEIGVDVLDFEKSKSTPEPEAQKNETEVPQQTVVIEKTEKEKQPKYPIQTEDLCNINDVYAVCVTHPTIQSFNLSETELMQEVRKLIKTFDRQIRFNQEINANISCISRSNLPALLNKLIANFQKAKNKKAEAQRRAEEKNNNKEAKKQTASRRYIALWPIHIQKYIPKKLWKDICRECGKNAEKQRIVLENIAAVNTDINETLASTHIQIINPDTYERTTSSYLKREDVNCIVQSITTSLCKDNKRIVWSYLPEENILVCTGVFSEHTKTKSGNNYSKTRDFASINMDANGKKITVQRIIDEEYLNVEDLLNSKDNEPKQEKQPSATRTSVLQDIKEPAKDVEQVKGPAKVVEQPKTIQPAKPHNLVETYAFETYVDEFIKLIDKTVKDGLENVPTESDIAKQLKQIDDVRDLLVQKAKIQNMIPEFNKTSDLLKTIRSNISHNLTR